MEAFLHCHMVSFPGLIPVFITITFLVEGPFIDSLAPKSLLTNTARNPRAGGHMIQPLDSVKDSVLCRQRKLANMGIMIQVEVSFVKNCIILGLRKYLSE